MAASSPSVDQHQARIPGRARVWISERVSISAPWPTPRREGGRLLLRTPTFLCFLAGRAGEGSAFHVIHGFRGGGEARYYGPPSFTAPPAVCLVHGIAPRPHPRPCAHALLNHLRVKVYVHSFLATVSSEF